MYGIRHYGVDADQEAAPPLLEETDYVGLLEQYGPVLGS